MKKRFINEWILSGVLSLGLFLTQRSFGQDGPPPPPGLELIPTNALPESGTFWMLSQTNAPPLPFFPYAGLDVDVPVPVYLLDSNAYTASYVVDDRAVVTVETALRSLERQFGLMANDLPGLPGDGGGDTNSDNEDGGGSYGNFKPNYTTNDLWLELLAVTNSTAALAIHPAWNAPNDVYDLLYTTDIAPPSAWQRLLRTEPGQTNLTVANAADAQGFYRLGPPNDLAANSSLGTNFWGTFTIDASG